MSGGLNLGIGGGIGSRVRVAGGTAAQPATLVQTAYGQGAAASPPSSGIEPWHLGVAVPIAAVLWLGFLRWSLPG
jgi:hypothetical protein